MASGYVARLRYCVGFDVREHHCLPMSFADRLVLSPLECRLRRSKSSPLSRGPLSSSFSRAVCE